MEFSRELLTEKERLLYDALKDKDKASFERDWLNVQAQKEKLKIAKKRLDKKAAAMREDERKKRTHQLIEIGGCFDSVFKDKISLSDIDKEKLIEYLNKYKNSIISQISKSHTPRFMNDMNDDIDS